MKRLAAYSLLTFFLLASSNLYAEYLYEDIDTGDEAFPMVEERAYYAEPEYYVEEEETQSSRYSRNQNYQEEEPQNGGYVGMPSSVTTRERVIIVNPRIHAWGAYSEDGRLLNSGVATSGRSWCSDIGRPCRTKTGAFRINSLGSENCISSKFPVGEGGAPMPFCMYFNGGQGIHGSNEVREANLSHGCVRVSVSDARWIRYNFARLHTKVIILSY